MRTLLDNGLTVLLDENRAARVAALQLWVKVGAADETPDQAGLAHLHEHMLFKGTARRGPGEIARAVESCGGEINAWTSYDQTVYHLVVASEFFGEGLDVLADAVTRSAFDPAELAREIEVVCEEIRRSEDQPTRRNSKALFDLAFSRHPYGRPVIGSEQSVRSFTREKILAFYRHHYVASNMVLVAVGDFDRAAALAAVKAAFAHVPQGVPTRSARPPEPAQTDVRVKVHRAPVKEAYLSAAFHVPGANDPDTAALDLLATLLGQGEAARLPLALKREKNLVNEVGASAWTPDDPGLFIASASLPAEKAPDALAELLRQAYRTRVEEFAPEEVARAQRILESETVFQRETVQGMARKHGFFETVCGHVDEAETYLQRVATATAADLRRVAARRLITPNLSISLLLPDDAPSVDAAALAELARRVEAESRPLGHTAPPRPYTRLTRPTSSAARRREPGGARLERLANGVTLVVQADPTVPIVALRAAWVGGLRAETPADNGIHGLAARCLLRGTARRPAEALAREIDELAAGLSGSAGRNSFGLRGEFLAADLDQSLDLFADVLLRPAFAEAEVTQERALVLEELRTRDDSPARAAFQLFNDHLWAAHPYRMDPTGRDESVRALDGAALQRLVAGRYGLDRLVLSVVGDASAERVRELVLRHFDVRSTSLVPPAEPAREAPLDGPRDVSRRLDRKQAHLVVGFRGLPLGSPRRWALEVLSAVLSGQGGRLFLELRDKRSLAYSVSSMVSEGLDPGSFAVYIGTSPEKLGAARAGIRHELERLLAEDVPEAELARARRYLVGAHEIGLQRLSSRAAVLALDTAYGLGPDHHLRHAERIRAVTAADVRQVAAELVDFGRAVTAVVSPTA